MATKSNKLSKIIKTVEERTDLRLISSGVIIFVLLSLISFGVATIPNLFNRNKNQQQITSLELKPAEPLLSKDKIEQVKEDVPTSIRYDKRINILDRPLETPGFITDSDKLTEYLAKNTNTVYIRGIIDKAQLYVKSTKLDIQKESIYFYMYDGTGFGGHLFPTESISNQSDGGLLYDMNNLPYIQLPYSLSKPASHIDAVDKLLNFNSSEKSRKYYIGGFVSTTYFPNSLEKMDIYYTCKSGSDCLIYK